MWLVIPHKQAPAFQEAPVLGQGDIRLEAFFFCFMDLSGTFVKT